MLDYSHFGFSPATYKEVIVTSTVKTESLLKLGSYEAEIYSHHHFVSSLWG